MNTKELEQKIDKLIETLIKSGKLDDIQVKLLKKDAEVAKVEDRMPIVRTKNSKEYKRYVEFKRLDKTLIIDGFKMSKSKIDALLAIISTNTSKYSFEWAKSDGSIVTLSVAEAKKLVKKATDIRRKKYIEITKG